MKVVILAGGLGTRITEETHLKPKPMIEIGGKPILWHIMKLYSAHGHQRLRHLLRLQGLRDQGVLRQLLPAHVGRDLRHGGEQRCVVHQQQRRAVARDAGRYRRGHDDRRPPQARARATSRTSRFCFTYGDGVSDIDIGAADRIPSRPRQARHGHGGAAAGPLRRARASRATAVRELHRKAAGDGGWINGGFFVLSPRCSTHRGRRHQLGARAARRGLRADGQLMAFEHRGFWHADGHAARQDHARRALGIGQGAVEKRGDGPQADFWRGGGSSSPGTPASRAAGSRSGCSGWAQRSPACA